MISKELDAPKIAAVLPAGGLGTRMGGPVPKQLMELHGRPLWRYSIDTFLQQPRVGHVVLVVPKDWLGHFERELQGSGVRVVEGGAERWLSVRHGIQALPEGVEYALVHDVARPFLSSAIIDAVVQQVVSSACIVAKPVHDTVKLVDNGRVSGTVDRSKVWLAQTPQAFRVQQMQGLYALADSQGLPFVPTDEASFLEHFGVPVAVVSGDSWNDKVTTSEDFERFHLALLAQESSNPHQGV